MCLQSLILFSAFLATSSAIVMARHLRFRGLLQVAHLVASEDTRKLLTEAGAVPPVTGNVKDFPASWACTKIRVPFVAG
ncbi:MAG: hypothetical protein WCB11_25215 [Terriglobales bacterium]